MQNRIRVFLAAQPWAAAFSALTLSLSLHAQASGPATESVVVLDPFRINAAQDQGYRAGNSVSGTRLAVQIQDLPLTLNAFTEEFISDLQATDLYDIARFAPGVTSNATAFVAGTARYNIRGFNTQRPQRNGFPGAPNTDPIAVSRMEIVKGPASLLYGQINPGGIVNIITKEPLKKAAYYFRQQVGSDNFLRTEADLTGPISQGGALSYRLMGAFEQMMETQKPHEGYNWTVVPVLKWQPTSRLEFNASYETFRRHESPQAMMFPNIFPHPLPNAWGYVFPPGATVGPQPSTLPRDFNYSANSDYRETEVDSLFVDGRFNINEQWVLRASGSRSDNYVEHVQTGIAGVGTGLAGIGPNSLGRRPRYNAVTDFAETYQLELTGKYSWSKVKWQPLFGATIQRTSSRDDLRQVPTAQWPAAWDLTNPATWNRNTYFPTSAYARLTDTQVTLDAKGYYTAHSFSLLEDRLQVLAGVRRSESETVQRNLITGAPQPKVETSATTPQYGALYRITPAIRVFASYSESFFPVAQFLRVLEVPTGPAQPTQGEGSEAGIKLNLWSGRLSATLAAYEITNQNIVQSFVTVDPATGATLRTDVQSGSQRSEGFEMDATWTPNSQFQAYVSYSYCDAYVLTNPANPALVGRPLEATPQHLASVYMRYNFGPGALEGWAIHGGINYTGKKLMRVENPLLHFEPSTVVDFNIARTWKLRRGELIVAFAVKNALDEFYYDGDNAPPAKQRNFVLSSSLRF